MNNLLFKFLELIACENYDGHFTIMKFTTNWRVCFGTPNDREMINSEMEVGKTFEEAAFIAIKNELAKHNHGKSNL